MREQNDNILLSLKNITLRVRDRHILENTSWDIQKNQHWALIGPNGSGKTSLAKALVHEYFIVKGTTYRHGSLKKNDSIGYVSFEQQQDLHTYGEKKNHAFSFSGRIQDKISAGYVIAAGQPEKMQDPEFRSITALLRIHHILDRSVTSLSNGEVRKVLIARALIKKPALLILDEPFEGLDRTARKILEDSIDHVITSGTSRIVLATHRFEHLSSGITHILCLKDCRVVASGEKRDILLSKEVAGLYRKEFSGEKLPLPAAVGKKKSEKPAREQLVSMKNVNVAFDGRPVIADLSWNVFRGENWIVSGPNGAGKSTLFRLITGDLPQVYANNVSVCGYTRGSGESLWDIRKCIGYLSPEFHMEYRKTVSLEHVILSGYYDSVGLFRVPGEDRIALSHQWLEVLGFGKRKSDRLGMLSFGEQRLVLLARAMVKSPRLLILDEPLQGLDPENRKILLEMIDRFGSSGAGSIIYITHYDDEIGSCFTHTLKMDPTEKGLCYEISPV